MRDLYYGDNLPVLRDYIATESVDLIYLDPPFNSKREYNVLFGDADSGSPKAQVTAFEDWWTWDEAAGAAYAEIIANAPENVSSLVAALVSALGKNDVTAYLVMMTIRLIELHRVLKTDGSIYLHCDPTASHYLKVVMDSVFGPANFQNEVVWSYRTGGVSKRRWARKHDVLLFYSKRKNFHFTAQQERIHYEKAFFTEQKDDEGKYYADVYLRDVWDIPAVINVSKERLGYPTQKPLALLERIVTASSNPGDLVLDPFCGCGTAIHASEKLGRSWVGIDITHLAVAVMRGRMEGAFPGISFQVHGEPADLEGASQLFRQDAHQFQWWAVSLVKGQPTQPEKKGGDKGVDGRMVFIDRPDGGIKKVVISVKGGATNPKDVRDLHGVCDRENALGIFVTLREPTKDMKAAAAEAGTHKSELYGRTFPRVQIVTVAQLLANKTNPRAAINLPTTQAFLPVAQRETVGEQLTLPASPPAKATPTRGTAGRPKRAK